jgi:prolyl-tRNA editing enzyme YbaK/EbsC (Cys-tRNA(Pro) deacylase)
MMKVAVQRVIDAFAEQGVVVAPREFAEQTRTAQEAATAIGTSVAQIVKSLIFLADDAPILVLVSGANQVDVPLLAATLGQTITRASAEQVRAATGFAIGGVPPLGHSTPLPTFLDGDLLAFETVWAAAGTPHTVFAIAPQVLQRLTQARVVAVK